MKNRDFLFGGTVKPTRRRRSSGRGGSRKGNHPPLVGWRFVSIVSGVAVMFAGLGLWRVDSVFRARDHEIETHRLQEISRARRDRQTTLLARMSQLQRGEVLRGVAETSLGMTEPDPQMMETLTVPAEVTSRWLAAASMHEGDLPPREEAQTKD